MYTTLHECVSLIICILMYLSSQAQYFPSLPLNIKHTHK